MRSSLRRHLEARLRTSGLLIAVLLIGGCQNPAGEADPASGSPIPSITVDPGQFITVSDPAIHAGVPVAIEFTGANGYVTTYEAYNPEEGFARVPVPAIMDMVAGVFGAGEVNVGIRGAAPLMRLSVADLPPAEEGAVPGGTLRDVLAAAVEAYQYELAGIAAVQADTAGQIDASSLISGINELITTLQGMIAAYDATGRFTVPDPTGDIALTDEQMLLADRLLTAVYTGLADELIDIETGAADNAKNSRLWRKGGPAPRQGFNANVAIAQVKNSIRRGTGGASLLSSAVSVGGLIVCGAGLVASSPGVLLVGGVIAVIGAATAYAEGLAGGRNTDAFLNRDPKRFNSGTEAISQIARYGSNLAPAIPGPLGTAANVVNVATTAKDFYSNAASFKCQGKTPKKKRTIQPASFEVDLQVFCEGIGLPPETTSDTDSSGQDADSDGQDADSDGQDTDSDGVVPSDCPVPPGAGFRAWIDADGGLIEEYRICCDWHNVGPYHKWTNESKAQLLREGCYNAAGGPEGWYRTWYPTGVLERETWYEGGLRNGVERLFRTDGTRSYEWHWLAGKEHGRWTSWYLNGQRSSEEDYQQGLKHGVSRHWYETGVPHTEFNYENGFRKGEQKFWYSNEQQDTVANYDHDGTKDYAHGRYQHWTATGVLTRDCIYDHNSCISCSVGVCPSQ